MEIDVDGGATDDNKTAELVVLTANGVRVACGCMSIGCISEAFNEIGLPLGAGTNTDSGDGGAVETDENCGSLENDVQESEYEASCGGGGTICGIAALNGSECTWSMVRHCLSIRHSLTRCCTG